MECYRGWDWNFYYDVFVYSDFIYYIQKYICEIILDDNLEVIIQ